MPAPVETAELLDLKLMPAWLREPPDARSYQDYEGEESENRRPGRPERRPRRPKGERDRRPPDRRAPGRPNREKGPRRGKEPNRDGRPRFPRSDRSNRGLDLEREVLALASRLTVRFVPHLPVFENVAAQIKSSPIAYSVFSLARLFLEKPERYDVQLIAKAEEVLFALGENPAVSTNRQFLEASAFRTGQEDFYLIEVTETEPVKGNFSSVARCRASGMLLGPTNHHAYQPRLRNLYEQRFSRRMSFPEYQRQIEIVTDPVVVEQWKEDARKITTFKTVKEETPLTLSTATEAERHFRQNYLPGLVQTVNEKIISGPLSRRLPDRVLRRLIEEAWSKEARSPSQMMHELSTRLRENGLQIFRHRKGMLFVSSVRVRRFSHEEASVSAQVGAILQAIGATPGIGRKELADNLLAGVSTEEVETRKIALAADLHWLISEGYVIEFNDGSLDLPRTKVKPVGEKAPAAEQAPASSNESAQSAEADRESQPVASTTAEPDVSKAKDEAAQTEVIVNAENSSEASGGTTSVSSP